MVYIKINSEIINYYVPDSLIDLSMGELQSLINKNMSLPQMTGKCAILIYLLFAAKSFYLIKDIFRRIEREMMYSHNNLYKLYKPPTATPMSVTSQQILRFLWNSSRTFSHAKRWKLCIV